MVKFNLSYDQNIRLEQRVAYEVAANILKSFLTDNVTVDIHFVGTSGLNGGNAIGGAVPIFHRVNYGILSAYIAQDASSYIDDQSVVHLQTGNTIDLSAYGEVIDGNTEILLTTAQAEALGLDEALQLENGGVWDRDVVDTVGLDGYILINQDFEWNNDVLRTDAAPEDTLDSLSLAMHEMLHIMGFVSGIDGTIEFNQLLSGETQVTGTTLLDLFRYSDESSALDNPDGSVSTITEGEAAYLSADGGLTNLGDFATGQGGDGYQASHWQRMQVALGIMDPTLAFQERLSISERDLQALDLLGWDVNYSVLESGLNMEALLLQAEQTVAVSLGLDSSVLTEHRAAGDAYTMSFSEWWALFEDQIIEMGFSEWWQVLEVGYDEWMQQQENPNALLQMGFSEWWQSFEATIIEMGFSEWWQSFETNMLNMGFSEWWQVLEMGFSEWWQQLETYFSVLEKTEGTSLENKLVADGGVRGRKAKVFRGGDNDDIIAGDEKQDRIKAGDGDDLVDGKEGHDVIWGEAGRDMLYGQNGNDLLYGGDDDDLLLGEAGDDRLRGGAGDDIASGGSGDDIVAGGEGRDDLKGGWGRDVLDGGDGNDLLKGEADSDVLIGGEGRDQVHGGGGDDVIYGDAYQGSGNLRALRRQLQEQAGTNSNSASETAPAETATFNPIRVEAESMTLSGGAFIHTNWSNDSGDSVKTTGSSTSSTIFSGPSGDYMVVVRYFDKASGAGRLDFGLDGTSLNSFNLDQETDHYYTRTVAQNITLNTGDEFAVTATSDGTDEAALDYIEFIPLDSLLETPLEQVTSSSASVSNASTTSSDRTVSASASTTETTFRLEAEAMSLVGDYYTESNSTASGGSLIAVSNQGQGKALSTFSGEAGYYNIVVGYYDESDEGIGQLSAALNNTELDAWSLDQNFGSILADAQTFTTRTVASTVFLRDGDIFELTGRRGEGSSSDELARIDYVDFVKVDFSGSEQTNQPTVASNTLADERLIAHWMFDETNGALVSDTTTAHNSTVVNASANNNVWEQGKFGRAINLDGVDDYVAVADSSAINLGIHTQRTVSLWFKADDKSVANRKQVLYEEGGGGRGLNIYIHDGQLYVGGWNRPSNQSNWSGTYLQTDDIVSGQWHHVALVLDGDEQVRDGAFTAYLDGVQFATGEGSQLWKRGGNIGFGAVNDGTRFHDGTGGSTSSNAFAGSLDEARIYNRALETTEIVSIAGRNNDFLQGGVGNDTIYGGEGDDTIFGNTDGDTSTHSLAGAKTYNGHTYLFSSLGTWDEAQAEARRLGGNLVTINDAVEEAWIRSNFSSSERLWMGLNDAAVEGQFEWISGEAVTYTNWAPGEPNNSGGGQDYGVINYFEQWDDTAANGAAIQIGEEWIWMDGLRGVIEIDTTDNDVLVGGDGNDTIYGNGGDDALYGDSQQEVLSPLMVEAEGFSLGGGYFVEALEGVSGGDVIRTDTSGTAGLSFSGPDGTYDIVVHYFDENDGSSTLALSINGTETDSWVLNQNTGSTHIVSDSRTISGVNLNTSDTVQISAIADNAEFARIDYVEFIPVSSASQSAPVVDGEIYNGSRYILTDTMQWHEAQDYAESLGGNLVTINNAAEEAWIQQTFGTDQELWVGFTDEAVEGQFEWVSGEEVTYSNWVPGKPDNSFGVQHYAYINQGGGTQWDDDANWTQRQGIIEIKLPETDGSEVTSGGNDVMIGGIGSDTLYGGAGNDFLDGSDAIAAGYFEQDILGGGLGADTFVVGNANQAYYLGDGDKDFVLIKDFNAAEDVVQLHGSAGDYTQQQQGNDTYLSHQGDTSDLVAVFENTSSVNLNIGFVFV